jgi:hypothetical protein
MIVSLPEDYTTLRLLSEPNPQVKIRLLLAAKQKRSEENSNRIKRKGVIEQYPHHVNVRDTNDPDTSEFISVVTHYSRKQP